MPDNGKIIVQGKEFSSLTPTSSEENGIGVIYQEFNLVGAFCSGKYLSWEEPLEKDHYR